MPNVANQPFADLLAKTYPAPDGVKIFTASADAQKMLAFWSVKQTTKSVVLRVGNSLAKFTLHACPHCEQHLSAQSTKMTSKEREMIASLMAIMQAQTPAKAASKPAKKQASARPTPAPSEEDLTLEQLDALTQPGGGA